MVINEKKTKTLKQIVCCVLILFLLYRIYLLFSVGYQLAETSSSEGDRNMQYPLLYELISNLFLFFFGIYVFIKLSINYTHARYKAIMVFTIVSILIQLISDFLYLAYFLIPRFAYLVYMVLDNKIIYLGHITLLAFIIYIKKIESK